jgi:hypothetical protein
METLQACITITITILVIVSIGALAFFYITQKNVKSDVASINETIQQKINIVDNTVKGMDQRIQNTVVTDKNNAAQFTQRNGEIDSMILTDIVDGNVTFDAMKFSNKAMITGDQGIRIGTGTFGANSTFDNKVVFHGKLCINDSCVDQEKMVEIVETAQLMGDLKRKNAAYAKAVSGLTDNVSAIHSAQIGYVQNLDTQFSTIVDAENNLNNYIGANDPSILQIGRNVDAYIASTTDRTQNVVSSFGDFSLSNNILTKSRTSNFDAFKISNALAQQQIGDSITLFSGKNTQKLQELSSNVATRASSLAAKNSSNVFANADMIAFNDIKTALHSSYSDYLKSLDTMVTNSRSQFVAPVLPNTSSLGTFEKNNIAYVNTLNVLEHFDDNGSASITSLKKGLAEYSGNNATNTLTDTTTFTNAMNSNNSILQADIPIIESVKVALAAKKAKEIADAAQRQREAEAAAQRQREAEAAAQRQREAEAAAQRQREAEAAAQRQREAEAAQGQPNTKCNPWWNGSCDTIDGIWVNAALNMKLWITGSTNSTGQITYEPYPSGGHKYQFSAQWQGNQTWNLTTHPGIYYKNASDQLVTDGRYKSYGPLTRVQY